MSRAGNRGFTMVEAVVSLLVTGFVIAGIGTLTGQWARSWNRGSGSLQRSELLAVGLDRIVADIAAARPVGTPTASRARLFKGQPDQLIFVRDQVGPFARSSLELVRFSNRVVDGQMSLVRGRAPLSNQSDNLDRVTWKDEVVVIRWPLHVVFGYWDEERTRTPRWEQKPTLPRSVSIELYDQDQGPLPGSTKAQLRTALPAYCASADSVKTCLQNDGGPTQPQDNAPKTLGDAPKSLGDR